MRGHHKNARMAIKIIRSRLKRIFAERVQETTRVLEFFLCKVLFGNRTGQTLLELVEWDSEPKTWEGLAFVAGGALVEE